MRIGELAALVGISGGLEEAGAGFTAAFYAYFAPAQAAAIRRAIDLMRKETT